MLSSIVIFLCTCSFSSVSCVVRLLVVPRFLLLSSRSCSRPPLVPCLLPLLSHAMIFPSRVFESSCLLWGLAGPRAVSRGLAQPRAASHCVAQLGVASRIFVLGLVGRRAASRSFAGPHGAVRSLAGQSRSSPQKQHREPIFLCMRPKHAAPETMLLQPPAGPPRVLRGHGGEPRALLASRPAELGQRVARPSRSRPRPSSVTTDSPHPLSSMDNGT